MIEFEVGRDLAGESGEALAVPVFAERTWGPGADWVVEQMGPWLEEWLEAVDFSGKADEIVSLPTDGRIPFRDLFLVGLGDEADLDAVRRAGGWLGGKAHRVTDLAVTFQMLEIDGAAQSFAEGFLLGQYRFDKYRSEPKPALTERVRFVGDGAEAAAGAAKTGAELAGAVALARDLVNEPAQGKSPEMMAALAGQIGDEFGIRVVVHDEDDIIRERFGGLAGVAAGAHRPARMVEFWYEPAEARAFIALVGKGIVFDSGGLSLKPPAARETMKTDMSGAASVFGAVRAIAALKLPVKVLGITPLTENMPGGGATRPGDVLTARNGKTIEVLNTDAEGRLVLADALALAAESQPDLIVDLATLTGACRIALGDKIAGSWTNDSDWQDRVIRAGASAGERIWPMPLPADYRKNIDSTIADMKNTGNNRYGGAINAALLLAEFVGDVPWVHLDIAGPARWPEDEHYQRQGGSGFGVRTLVELAGHLAGRP